MLAEEQGGRELRLSSQWEPVVLVVRLLGRLVVSLIGRSVV